MDQPRNRVLRKSGRRKKVIAKLPSGVGVTQTRNGAGREYWRVRLGKRFTGGLIVKKDFADLAGAREWIDKQKKQEADTGAGTYTLTSDQLAEARNAFQRLAGTGLTLTAAVTDSLSRHRKPEDALKWEESLKAWLTAPRSRVLDPRTAQAYSISHQFLAAEMKKEKLLPHQVEKKHVQAFLLDDEWEWQAPTIAHHLRNLSCFFSWMEREKWRTGNPCRGIPEPESLAEIHVLSPAAAKHLLDTASGSMRVCVALGMFAGLRTSEVRRLEWCEIGETEIEIKSGKTKTRRNRMVPILPALAAVLSKYDGPREGLVAPERWKKEFEALVGVAGYRGKDGESTWPTNAMRHSYGTYRLAELKNENVVAADMGNSPQMIHSHYRRVVQSRAVTEFWAIRPN